MQGNRAVQKYLRSHAETVIEVASGISSSYETAVVIPVYNEDAAGLSRSLPPSDGQRRHIAIVVVNQPTNATEADRMKNEMFLQDVRLQGASREISAEVTLVQEAFERQTVDVLLIDATKGRYALRKKEGVGRARKIGFDLALALHHADKLAVPYVGSLDADVVLPLGYVDSLMNAAAHSADGPIREYSALLYPYCHIASADGQLQEAMTKVELGFRYYVLGLAHAGSPYAYHSLGSALAVSLPHYAEVRGVPNRQAGEDFHLLSKLSKLAPLRRLASPTISIETRVSKRVPFGTGPALEKALRGGPGEVMSYHPEVFEYLRSFLEQLAGWARVGDGRYEFQLESHVPAWVKQEAQAFMASTHPHLKGCPTAAHRERRVHERFDALRTLQFVHRAHREGLFMLPIAQALEKATFLSAPAGPSEMLEWCKAQEASLTGTPGLFPAS